jgi:hypothetical protein
MRFLKHVRREDTKDDEIHEAESHHESSEELVADLPPPPLVTVGGLSDERPEDEASEPSGA